MEKNTVLLNTEQEDELDAQNAAVAAEVLQDAPAEEVPTEQSVQSPDSTDYAELMRSDLAEIRGAIRGLDSLESISQLKDPLRYGALRDLGLSATEAFLATGGIKAHYDNRSHLTSSVPAGATGAMHDMPRQEYEMLRDIFDGMSDAQLKKLYRKVTK